MRDWVTRSIRTRLVAAIGQRVKGTTEFGTKKWRSQGAWIEEAIEEKLRREKL